MKNSYSEEFKKLIQDQKGINRLIEGSLVRGYDFEGWTRMRSLIARAVDRDGTILDIGCANGFLLRCLQEWSGHRLIPYGVDTEKDKIEEARELFPNEKDHFIVGSISQLDEITQAGLPNQYNIVYWNVWDKRYFEIDEDREWLQLALRRVKKAGRLVLGFYDKEKENNTKRVLKLKKLGYELSGIIENDYGTNEVIAWIDKK